MGKTKRDTASAAEASFHRHYAAIWGEERWHESLFPALVQPTRYAALVNRYTPRSAFDEAITGDGTRPEDLETISFPTLRRHQTEARLRSLCVIRKIAQDEEVTPTPSASFPPPERVDCNDSNNRLMMHWNLDAASLLVVHMLDVQPGDNVLDLCAAPGGKSIALAQSLFPPAAVLKDDKSITNSTAQSGILVANESDIKRYKRLSENLNAYIPSSLLQSRKVVPTRFDGSSNTQHALQALVPGEENKYDRVLVDAPCSSERHVIHAHVGATVSGHAGRETGMASWRSGTSKRLQETQVKLLMTALKVSKVGGRVVYATCSLEPGENDGVVEKVLALVEKERKKGVVKWGIDVGFSWREDGTKGEEELEREWAEKTKCGWIVLPDHPSGGKWGPLFFAVLTKVEGDLAR